MTDKQARFIEEYCIDFNATQAAIRAGYSENTAYNIGWENVRKREIAEAIDKRLDDLAMGTKEALVRLGEQGRNIQMRYLRESGSIDLERLISDGYGHLVKGTKHDAKGNLVVEFYDAQAAITTILKAGGAFGPSGSEDDPVHLAPIQINVINKPDAGS